MATISKNDVWAVGATFTDTGESRSRALVEHFNGRSWTVVALPGTAGTGLASVAAVSATDVWAVGGGRTLHWDGRAWSVSADPSALTARKVEAGRGGLVMALAWNSSSGQFQVLARHANTWQPISAPALPPTAAPCDGGLLISGLTVLTTSDLWVVGGTSKGGNFPTSGCPYAAHWNGLSWTASVPPNPAGDPVGNLNAVSARADGVVWAVGDGYHMDPKTGMQYERGFAVRWNGSSWQSLCNFGCFTTDFLDIDARGTNVWITAGDVLVQTASHHMYLSRWAGNGWAAQQIDTVPSGFPGIPPQNYLGGVSARGGTVASAGHSEGGGVINPLVDIRDDD
ncbi:MAG TPA: hypothetical protein VHX15_05980 [Frankiaceae bacterium]|nr:hypothetical protein [Frankiaceae bacterium]